MTDNSRVGGRRRKFVVRAILGVIAVGLIVFSVLKGSLSWEDEVKYLLFAGLAVFAASELIRQRAKEERAALEADTSTDADTDVDPDRQG